MTDDDQKKGVKALTARAKKNEVHEAAPEQISLLPSPVEDSIAHSNSVSKAKSSPLQEVRADWEKRYTVIGEKQFKNPMLFPPPNTKGLDVPRRFVYGVASDESGDDIERSIVVLGNNVTSGYTSDTLEIIATVNNMWREQGSNPEGVVHGTYAEVARRINRVDENNANRHRKHVAAELLRLKRVGLIFSQYHTTDSIRKNHEITYFSSFDYVTDRKNPSNNYWKAVINPYVLDNLRTGYIASLPLAALLSLKNDNSKPVLLKVDSLLASLEKCELSCDSIYELTCIESTPWFQKPVVRKRVLSQIQQDLDGKVLSSGWMIRVTLKEMVKGDDIKLVFHRTERVMTPNQNKVHKVITVINTDPVVIQMLINDMTSAIGQAHENASLYAMYARSYPEEVIRLCISQFKADKPADLKSPGAFFSSILSRVAQEHGFDWIKQ